MKYLAWRLIFITGVFLFSLNNGIGQEVKAKNSLDLVLSGRVQLQHEYNNRFKGNDSISSNGFRMRRVRLQVDAHLTTFLSAKIQIEGRDNAPRLKDAEGKLKLLKDYYFSFGQFKVPVWREEFMRSSGNLMLVERRAAADFLLINLLSGRQIGIQFGGTLSPHFSFAFNYSNGSGEGVSEIEKIIVSNHIPELDINNGKMYVGRIDADLNDRIKFGISAAVNDLGGKIDTVNNSGRNTVIEPDFGIYLPSRFELEGGVAFGSIAKSFIKTLNNQNYFVSDLTGRWTKMLPKPNESLGGLSGYEIAAGFSYIDIKSNELNERNAYRFGPSLYFGKKSRLQVNMEIVSPAIKRDDTFWRIRSQFTVNL